MSANYPRPDGATPTYDARVPGTVYRAKGYLWPAGLSSTEREGVARRVMQLPQWLAGVESAANLDVTPLEGAKGFFRLRVGRYRAIFQRLGEHIVLHALDTRGDVYAPTGSPLSASYATVTVSGCSPQPLLPTSQAPRPNIDRRRRTVRAGRSCRTR